MVRLLALAAALPLAFAGCTSTNPQGAFDDVAKHVASRTGQEVRWMREDAERGEIEKAVESLLQSNLTARSAVAVALLNNRTLQADFESIGVSQAELAQASRLRNPQFSGFWRLPTQGPTVVNAAYSLAQDFLDLLTLPARKKIAARNLEGTKLRVAHAVLRQANETEVALYTVQARQQLTNRLNIVVEVNEAAADIARRQHDAGNITELEFYNQQTAYAQSRLDLARVQAQVRADRERLNRLLGLWGKQTAWQIADELPPIPDKELPLENLEALAASRRFDLGAAREGVQNVLAALKLKKRVRWIPAANLGVSAERELDQPWVIGPTLDLEVPLFDQGQAELARLNSEYRRAQRNFEALAVNIRSEVRETRDTLIAARDAAEYFNKVLLPQRQRILRETLLQYNAMQKSNFELLAAKEREQLAEREAIEALRDYWIARAELERVVGGSLTREVSSLTSLRPAASPDSTRPEKHHDEHKH
jgi:cobalt-zinc-cadmium efflux system outer membrane protein